MFCSLRDEFCVRKIYPSFPSLFPELLRYSFSDPHFTLELNKTYPISRLSKNKPSLPSGYTRRGKDTSPTLRHCNCNIEISNQFARSSLAVVIVQRTRVSVQEKKYPALSSGLFSIRLGPLYLYILYYYSRSYCLRAL